MLPSTIRFSQRFPIKPAQLSLTSINVAKKTFKEYYNLGSYIRIVTTKSLYAELWVNRGLTWSYAFTYEESAKYFEKAIAADPDRAMPYWGLAYSLGLKYNKTWDFFDDHDLQTTVDKAHRATALAAEKVAAAWPVEKALAHAIQARYPWVHDQHGSREETSIWSQEYAEAMTAVCREFPNDLDVAALCVDALMNLTPWKLWDLRSRIALGTVAPQVLADRA